MGRSRFFDDITGRSELGFLAKIVWNDLRNNRRKGLVKWLAETKSNSRGQVWL